MTVINFNPRKQIEYKYVAFRDVIKDDVKEAARAAGITPSFSEFSSGQHEDFIRFIVSKVCLFDGKSYTPEELKGLNTERLAELGELITIKIRWEIYRGKEIEPIW